MHAFRFIFQSSPVIDPWILALAVSSNFSAFVIALVVCDLGERTNNAHVSVGDMIDQFDWYSFTDDMQRMLPIIFIQAHEPVGFKCYGSITCSRETFKNVGISDAKNLTIRYFVLLIFIRRSILLCLS